MIEAATAPSRIDGGRSAASRSLVLGLYAFAVFGWELVVVLAVDPLLRLAFEGSGPPPAPASVFPPVLHWLITAAGWVAGARIVHRAARAASRGVPDAAFDSAPMGPAFRRIAVVTVAVMTAILVRVVALGHWKLPAEAADTVARYAPLGAVALVALLLYYAAEVVVIVLLLRLGQRAGELRFGRPRVPWGGFLLAGTWGIVHIALQGPSTGLYAVCASLLYGIILVMGPRRGPGGALLIGTAFVL